MPFNDAMTYKRCITPFNTDKILRIVLKTIYKIIYANLQYLKEQVEQKHI